MKEILVPIDFSPVTSEVLKIATSLAKTFHSHLWLIHVAAPDPDFVGFEPGPQVVRDQIANDFHKKHQLLQDLAEDLKTQQIKVTPLFIQGPTVETLLNKANEFKADLVVLASHGHSALYRLLLGSVSEGVLRGSSCPVLIVPAQSNKRS